MGVAARDHAVARGGERAVEPGRDRAVGIGDPAHGRKPPVEQRARRAGPGAVGNDHLDGPAIVLGED